VSALWGTHERPPQLAVRQFSFLRWHPCCSNDGLRRFIFPIASQRFGLNFTTYRIVHFDDNAQVLRAVVSPSASPKQGTR